MDVEKITPYNNDERKSRQVKAMFDSIAPAYDFMNRAMTLGIDRWWRRVAVKMMKRRGRGKWTMMMVMLMWDFLL